MSQADLDAMKQLLNAFNEKLQTKKAEFERDGHFKDVHDAHWQRICAAHTHLYGRVHALPADGSSWAVLKHELHRDFEAVAEDLDRLVDRLDANGRQGS